MPALRDVKIAEMDRGYFSAYFWDRKLTFAMPRMVNIQIWQLGLLNLVLQAAVLGYVVYSFFGSSQHPWAYKEQPSNQINAWIDGSAARAAWQSSSSSMTASYPYCGNSSYEFTYSEAFVYTNAQCEAINAFEITNKLPGTAALATVYMDIYEEGWDCSAADAATRASNCTAGGGSVSTLFATQCLCTTRRTTYPVGTETMNMSFTHAYHTSSYMGWLQGNSQLVSDNLDTTTIELLNGSSVVFQPGETVTLSIAEWLRAAGIGLDDLNTVSTDLADSSRHPYFRTTGATVLIDIDYTNIKKGETHPEWDRRMVHATVTVKVERDWAGLAVRAPIYETLPTGPLGAKTYSKLLRYSQGVVFKFSGKGWVYRITNAYVIAVLINAVVMLGISATITSFVATHLWPTRKMITNKTKEKLSIGSRLSEIAIKAATHAANYSQLLDVNKDGKLRVDDFVEVFQTARAPITGDQAQTLAAMIISRSNDENDTQHDDKQSMDFIEYMNAMEGGSMISFEEATRLALTLADRKGYMKHGSMKKIHAVHMGDSW